MFIAFRLSRRKILVVAAVILISSLAFSYMSQSTDTLGEGQKVKGQIPAKSDFIKWVDFKVTATAMAQAMKYDTDSYGKEIHLDWIELLAVLGARYGGDFSKYKRSDLDALAGRILKGEKIEDISRDMKYYSYYRQAYEAVLGEYVGEYQIQQQAKDGSLQYEKKYGLKAFSPIAKNYGYSHFDDFGASRSYGYKRKHLGHDMMGNVGTPIIAIESGTVEAIGWNRYGGWRLGIRSFDKKRYYYYAHLRKDKPYPADLSIGHTVKAGDVVGYLGMTGYSSKENTNNIDTPHLHMGIQLIFDESQKDGNGEIWISCYEISKLLSRNTSEVQKDDLTKELRRKYDFFEPSVENME